MGGPQGPPIPVGRSDRRQEPRAGALTSGKSVREIEQQFSSDWSSDC